MHYRPWLDEDDGDNVLFVSTHGYGARDTSITGRIPEHAPRFYPGSGSCCGWDPSGVESVVTSAAVVTVAAPDTNADTKDNASPLGAPVGDAAPTKARLAAKSADSVVTPALTPLPSKSRAHHTGAAAPSTAIDPQGRPSSLSLLDAQAPEPLFERGVRHPRIINVGMAPGSGPTEWRRILTADVFPRIASFAPDIIFVSAGFDAHYKVGLLHSLCMWLALYWRTVRLLVL